MKTIKSVTILLLLFIATCTVAFSQNGNEYKLALSSGKLYVQDLGDVEFSTSSSNEVIIVNKDHRSNQSDRARGLKLINGLGLDDNTGIGLHIKKSDSDATLIQISRNSSSSFNIAVPKNVTIVYEHASVHGKTVHFKEVTNEIEVTTTHSGVRLEEVTGPMTISTVHGDIEGDFVSINQDNPISMFSTHGDIDLAIPSNSKAQLSLSTGWGEIYSDLDIEVNTSNSSMKRYGNNKVNGTINGGGVNMNIASTHGSIYLREK